MVFLAWPQFLGGTTTLTMSYLKLGLKMREFLRKRFFFKFQIFTATVTKALKTLYQSEFSKLRRFGRLWSANCWLSRPSLAGPDPLTTLIRYAGEGKGLGTCNIMTCSQHPKKGRSDYQINSKCLWFIIKRHHRARHLWMRHFLRSFAVFFFFPSNFLVTL